MATDSAASAAHAGRLQVRPPAAAALGLRPGTARLGLGTPRDALIHVPGAASRGPVGLVVLLHGAGADASGVIDLLAGPAEERGLAVLAPDARGATWDGIRGGFGRDVEFIERALNHVLARLPVDACRMALAGFSDGASYALSLAMGNGDLFAHVIAFSPGFAAPVAEVGRPRMFVSHGVRDPVLPIDRCSRRLVPRLRRAGYDVTYEEFEGGHVVPSEVAARAAAWLG